MTPLARFRFVGPVGLRATGAVSDCHSVQDYACQVFSHMASRREEPSSQQCAVRAKLIIDGGGVSCALHAMSSHGTDPFVQANATVALARLLATNGSLANELGTAGVHIGVIRSMTSSGNAEDVQSNGCLLLAHLAQSRDLALDICAAGGTVHRCLGVAH